MSKIIETFSNPAAPGSFSGLSGFLKNNPQFKKNTSSKTLLEQESFTLHKPIKNKFKRNKFITGGIDEIWQADLVDVSNIQNHNYNNKYILTCIDIFSKFAWAVILKDKSSKEVLKAFQKIFEKGRKPKKIHVDEGNEFKGDVSKYMNKLGINIYNTNSKMKASIVERFNRTIKTKMYRMFTYKKGLNLPRNKYMNYIPFLDKLVDSYNNSYHTSIKEKPNNVSTKNEEQIYYNLYGYKKQDGDDNIISFFYKIGDYVRIKVDQLLFKKGYTPNWTEEIFIINELIPRVPPVYKITSINGILLKNSYYKEELQKVYSSEFPYDTFEVLEQNKYQLFVKKLNNKEQEPYWITKKEFFEIK